MALSVAGARLMYMGLIHSFTSHSTDLTQMWN